MEYQIIFKLANKPDFKPLCIELPIRGRGYLQRLVGVTLRDLFKELCDVSAVGGSTVYCEFFLRYRRDVNDEWRRVSSNWHFWSTDVGEASFGSAANGMAGDMDNHLRSETAAVKCIADGLDRIEKDLK